jgi:hypothetical protein
MIQRKLLGHEAVSLKSAAQFEQKYQQNLSEGTRRKDLIKVLYTSL